MRIRLCAGRNTKHTHREPSGRVLFNWDSSRVTLRGHSAPVRGVAFVHDGLQVISCSEDKTLRLWDVERGTCQAVINTKYYFCCLHVSLNPPYLCAGDLEVCLSLSLMSVSVSEV